MLGPGAAEGARRPAVALARLAKIDPEPIFRLVMVEQGPVTGRQQVKQDEKNTQGAYKDFPAFLR